MSSTWAGGWYGVVWCGVAHRSLVPYGMNFTPLCIVAPAARWWCGPVGRRLLQTPSGPSYPWSQYSPSPLSLLCLPIPSLLLALRFLLLPRPFLLRFLPEINRQPGTWKCSFGLFDLHHIWAKLIHPDQTFLLNRSQEPFCPLFPAPSSLFSFYMFLFLKCAFFS